MISERQRKLKIKARGKQFVIYCTTNLITYKKYIGVDKWNDPKYLGSGKLIKAAIKKYGKENFIKEILQYCKDSIDADESEQYWIDYFGAVKSDLFYNLAKGGYKVNCDIVWNKGKTGIYSEETLKKIAEGSTGNKNASGKRTKEQIERISKATKKFMDIRGEEICRMGGLAGKGIPKPKSEEQIKKMSETKKRLYKEGKITVWNKGYKCSEEEKEQRMFSHPNRIEIYQLNKDTLEIIKKFNSISEIQRELGFDSGNIATSIKKGWNAYGYKWVPCEDYINFIKNGK